MISNEKDTVTQLVNYVVDSFNQRDMLIDKVAVQKVIYQVKMDLGEDHPLYDKIPYYWYYHGPYCELVSDSLNEINNFSNDYPVLLDFPESMDSIDNLLDKGDYVYADLTEDIYKKYAPLEVMHLFKYKIFNPTENEEFLGDEEEYFNVFTICLDKLLNIPFLHQFVPVFSSLHMQIDFLNDSNNIGKCWSMLRSPIRHSWFTFAEALRIHYHDDYYDNISDKWNIVFKNSLKEFKKEVFDLEDNTFDFIDQSLYGPYTEGEKRILDNTLGVYLRED